MPAAPVNRRPDLNLPHMSNRFVPASQQLVQGLRIQPSMIPQEAIQLRMISNPTAALMHQAVANPSNENFMQFQGDLGNFCSSDITQAQVAPNNSLNARTSHLGPPIGLSPTTIVPVAQQGFQTSKNVNVPPQTFSSNAGAQAMISPSTQASTTQAFQLASHNAVSQTPVFNSFPPSVMNRQAGSQHANQFFGGSCNNGAYAPGPAAIQALMQEVTKSQQGNGITGILPQGLQSMPPQAAVNTAIPPIQSTAQLMSATGQAGQMSGITIPAYVHASRNGQQMNALPPQNAAMPMTVTGRGAIHVQNVHTCPQPAQNFGGHQFQNFCAPAQGGNQNLATIAPAQTRTEAPMPQQVPQVSIVAPQNIMVPGIGGNQIIGIAPKNFVLNGQQLLLPTCNQTANPIAQSQQISTQAVIDGQQQTKVTVMGQNGIQRAEQQNQAFNTVNQPVQVINPRQEILLNAFRVPHQNLNMQSVSNVQPMSNVQSMSYVQPMANVQPMPSVQPELTPNVPMSNVQPASNAEPVSNAQIVAQQTQQAASVAATNPDVSTNPPSSRSIPVQSDFNKPATSNASATQGGQNIRHVPPAALNQNREMAAIVQEQENRNVLLIPPDQRQSESQSIVPCTPNEPLQASPLSSGNLENVDVGILSGLVDTPAVDDVRRIEEGHNSEAVPGFATSHQSIPDNANTPDPNTAFNNESRRTEPTSLPLDENNITSFIQEFSDDLITPLDVDWQLKPLESNSREPYGAEQNRRKESESDPNNNVEKENLTSSNDSTLSPPMVTELTPLESGTPPEESPGSLARASRREIPSRIEAWDAFLDYDWTKMSPSERRKRRKRILQCKRLPVRQRKVVKSVRRRGQPIDFRSLMDEEVIALSKSYPRMKINRKKGKKLRNRMIAQESRDQVRHSMEFLEKENEKLRAQNILLMAQQARLRAFEAENSRLRDVAGLREQLDELKDLAPGVQVEQ